MYGGYLILKSEVENVSDFISKLNGITEAEDVTWAEKPVWSPLTEALAGVKIEQTHFAAHVSQVSHDHAEWLLKNQLKDRLVQCCGTFHFKANGGWVMDEKHITHGLRKEMAKFDLCYKVEVSGEWKTKHVRESSKLLDDTIKWIFSLCEKDEKLLDRLHDHTKGKLYFRDCVYNFETGTTEPNDGNSFIVIPRDLKLNSNAEVRKQIYDRVLNPIFGCFPKKPDYETRCQLRDHYLPTARAFASYVDSEDKEWVVMLGNRNSGKGVLNDLFSNVFGSYVKATNTENFLYKNTSDETSKQNSFMLGLQFQRMVLGNECAIDLSGSTKLDGNKIKKFHSGGDYIEARRLYQNETEFRLQL